MTSCIPTGDGRDITPEDDEHIAWVNSGLRAGYAKAKRELNRYNAKPIQPTGQSKDGVAWINWAVHQLDDMEMNWSQTDDDMEMFVGWRAWKHLRNSLRDRFKEIYGVDPSPHYNPGAATQALSSAKASGNNTEPLPPQPNTNSLEGELRDLLKGSYACSRVWEAWQYGTMRQDDFYPLEEDDDVISDLAQLFNKYAREQVIAELAGVIASPKSNPYDGGTRPGQAYKAGAVDALQPAIDRIAELKEQRAKLKEEGK